MFPSVKAVSASIFFSLLCCSAVQAQQGTILLGPTAGYGVGTLSGSIPVYSGGADCGTFESGSGSVYWRGGRLILPSLFSEGLGMSLTGSWSQLAGSLSTSPADRQMALDAGNGELITLDREFRLDTRHSMVQLDLVATLNLAGNWRLMAGPWGGYQLSLSTDQVDSIRGPGRNSFADGQRSRPMTDRSTLTAAGALFGGLLAVAYEVPAGAGTRIVPEISMRGIFSSLAKEASLRQLSFGVGASVLFDLTPPVAPQAPPQVPAAPRLVASVDIDGIDESGAVVRVAAVKVSEIFDRSYTPFLPVVFFEPGSSTISSRYLDAVPEPKSSFSLGMVSERTAVDLHRFNLDIVGLRLRNEPTATLDLFGSTSAGEAAGLAAARVGSVRDYLVDTWGIDASRIRVGTGEGPMRRSGDATEDGRVENRRVELHAGSPTILAPVVTERVSREFNPPLIRMTPSMEAEAGVKIWTMDVSQGVFKVATYRSDDSSGADLQWRIVDERIDSIPSPMVVELTVEDSAGAVVRARDELPVAVERRVNIVERRGEGSADRTVYTLVGFDYNKSEPAAADRELLADIIRNTPSGSRLRVTGFTDRIGGEDYNRELSRRRADQVASVIRQLAADAGIGQIDVTIEAGGIQTGRFTNDRPEGRILSRGVQVVIERPRP